MLARGTLLLLVAVSCGGERGDVPGAIADRPDALHGPWTGQHLNGQTREQGSFRDGERHGAFRMFGHSGEQAETVTYVDGTPDGTWTSSYPGGAKRSEVTYASGKPNGSYTAWHRNGEISTTRSYTNGELDGLNTGYDMSGDRTSEYRYVRGVLDGAFTEWFANGQKRVTAVMRDGRYQGLFAAWFENGQRRSETSYLDGKLHGETTEWDEEGHVTVREWHEDNLPLRSIDSPRGAVATEKQWIYEDAKLVRREETRGDDVVIVYFGENGREVRMCTGTKSQPCVTIQNF